MFSCKPYLPKYLVLCFPGPRLARDNKGLVDLFSLQRPVRRLRNGKDMRIFGTNLMSMVGKYCGLMCRGIIRFANLENSAYMVIDWEFLIRVNSNQDGAGVCLKIRNC